LTCAIRSHDQHLSERRWTTSAVVCQKLPGADVGRDATVDFVIFSIELDREDDGRWLAEVPALAGVMCYGADRDEAVARVQALALRVIAERLEHREAPAEFLNVTFRAA
jgi:predicted RNase H-like HicB family nuclease